MRWRHWCGWAIAGAALLLVGAAPARADPSGPEVREGLTVAASRGEVPTRLLVVQGTGTLTDVHIVAKDLARSDGAAVLPAAAIQPAAAGPPVGGVITVPVQFDLQAAPSGEFTGNLLVVTGGNSQPVPVTVRVKDPWPLALLLLLLGVGLGLFVSAYRNSGRQRDRVLVRAGRLRGQLAAAGDPAPPFQARLLDYLAQADTALQADRWDAAGANMDQAEALWAKWRKDRAAWEAQLAYQHTLVAEQLPHLTAGTRYQRTVRAGLDDAAWQAPDLAGPLALRTLLDALADQITRYVQLKARIHQLRTLVDRLGPPDYEQWKLQPQALQATLDDLEPGDTPGYAHLLAAVDTARAQVQARVPAGGARDVAPAAVPVAEAPPVQLIPAIAAGQAAERRLRAFTGLSYALALFFLAGTGFMELYAAKPTFGAAGLADYFPLVLWGFGAEATRAAVGDMVRGWAVPGLEIPDRR